MELEIIKIDGQKTGRKVILDDNIFGIEPNDHAIYLDVKQMMANRRQGTHKSKERSEISGSTRKLKRQKGTGGARIGDIKSPLLRGGGRVFGPKPRDYSFKLNKKVKRLARKSALSYKALENQILVLEDFQLEAPRTKSFNAILKSLNLTEGKPLFIFDKLSDNVFLSARNIPNTAMIRANEINTYVLLNAKTLVLNESSIKVIEEMFDK